MHGKPAPNSGKEWRRPPVSLFSGFATITDVGELA